MLFASICSLCLKTLRNGGEPDWPPAWPPVWLPVWPPAWLPAWFPPVVPVLLPDDLVVSVAVVNVVVEEGVVFPLLLCGALGVIVPVCGPLVTPEPVPVPVVPVPVPEPVPVPVPVFVPVPVPVPVWGVSSPVSSGELASGFCVWPEEVDEIHVESRLWFLKFWFSLFEFVWNLITKYFCSWLECKLYPNPERDWEWHDWEKTRHHSLLKHYWDRARAQLSMDYSISEKGFEIIQYKPSISFWIARFILLADPVWNSNKKEAMKRIFNKTDLRKVRDG